MTILSAKDLKQRSEAIISESPSQIRLVILVHVAAVIVLSLLSNGITLLLNHGIASTGGLGGLGTRSILETAQTLLDYITSIFSPFWEMSLFYVAIRFARQIQTRPGNLLFSFRRAGRVLGYYLMQIAIIFLCGFLSGYIASIIFSFTSYVDPLAEVLEPFMTGAVMDLEAIPMDQLIQAYLPFLLIMLALFLPLCVFVSYCIRLAPYFIMDDPSVSAFGAIQLSIRAMRGSKIAMFKLDLSYWWFYLTEGVLMAVCYLDLILPALGIQLPFNETIAFFITLVLYGVLEIAFRCWLNGRIDITYALAYNDLRQELMDQLHPQTPPSEIC